MLKEAGMWCILEIWDTDRRCKKNWQSYTSRVLGMPRCVAKQVAELEIYEERARKETWRVWQWHIGYTL